MVFAPDRRLIFVRHGQSEANQKSCFSGRMDVGLSTVGQQQILAVAQTIRSEKPDRIFTSPLTRAKQTATAIADACETELQICHELVEQDYGAWDGMLFEDVKRQYADHYRAWSQGDPQIAPPQGEAMVDVGVRGDQFLGRIRGVEDGNQTLVVVAHAGILQAIMCRLLGTPLSNRWPFRLQPGTYARLDLHGDHASLTHLSCR